MEGIAFVILQLSIFKTVFTGKALSDPKTLRRFLIHYRGIGLLGGGLVTLAISLVSEYPILESSADQSAKIQHIRPIPNGKNYYQHRVCLVL